MERQGHLPELDPPILRPDHVLRSWRGEATTFAAQEYVLTLAEMLQRLLPGSLWLGGAITLPIPTQHQDRSFEIGLGWILELGV
ncbi:MAG: hypothetical protein HC818_07460 [Synechococcaceae cyanobacterium RM1_1_27]|nr:hypothetical protein [Synechococcaceae cyanobacterium SM2_3_2]NJO86371.1 hypothetical protein [Synechococcaceae cyanobacterium RM1_1_27]